MRRLTLLTDARGEKSPGLMVWADGVGEDRVVVASHAQADTMIVMPDLLWWGSVGRGLECSGIVTRDVTLREAVLEDKVEAVRMYKVCKT